MTLRTPVQYEGWASLVHSRESSSEQSKSLHAMASEDAAFNLHLQDFNSVQEAPTLEVAKDIHRFNVGLEVNIASEALSISIARRSASSSCWPRMSLC